MAKYLLIATQFGEGCDYMIDCGTSFEFFEADSIDDLEEKVKEWLGDRGCLNDDDMGLETFEVYGASDQVFNTESYKSWVSGVSEEIDSSEAKEKERKEREQLAYLTEKYK